MGFYGLVALVCTPLHVIAHAQESADWPAVRLAFVRAGDIYVYDGATRTELRLTNDALSTDPVWTTDGGALFFTRRQSAQAPETAPETWRWQPGGDAEPVQTGLWSPDGTAVAFLQPLSGAEPSATVWVSLGNQQAQITPAEAGIRWQPLAWSRDGQQLALVRYELLPGGHESGGLAPFTGATLWITDTDDPLDGPLRQLPIPPAGAAQPGVPDLGLWSPDGRVLLVGVGLSQWCNSCRADGVPFYSIPVTGGSPVVLHRALTDLMAGGLPGRLQTDAVAWSPDSGWLVVSAGDEAGRETYAHKQLMRFDQAGGERTDLSSNSAYADLEPVVSPDGQHIAFARGRARQASPGPAPALASTPAELIATRRVWIMQADGSGQRQLTDVPGWTDEAPVWTTDGRWLVFVRWHADMDDAPATAQLWAVHPDGSDPRQLVAELGPPAGLTNGFGYYGLFGWQRLSAVAPSS